MLSIEPRHHALLLSILAKYPYTFYAFGSRTTGTNRPFSDLDLCYIDPIPDTIKYQIEEDLDESYLPFRVDLISWEKAAPWFKESIKKDLTNIITGEKVS